MPNGTSRSIRFCFATAAAATLAIGALAGCSGNDGSSPSSPTPGQAGADTTCAEYVKLSQKKQVRVIQDTTRELDDEYVPSSDAAEATELITGLCEEDEFKDGTLRDIGAENEDEEQSPSPETKRK